MSVAATRILKIGTVLSTVMVGGFFCVVPVASAAAVPAFGSGNGAWNNYYNNPSDTSTWGPFCAGGGGHVAASGDGFPACGPTGGDQIEVPGGISTPGFQCVELSERVLYVEHKWTAISANGAQVAERYAAAHNAPLIHNGTSGTAPHIGDIMSFSDASNFSDTGHTGLVAASSVNSSGNGSIELLSENWSETGSLDSFTVSNWRVATVSGFAYSEWVQSGSGTTSGGGVGNGSFVQINSQPTVYEIVGGAPVAVTNWNNVGGPHPTTKLTQTQFDTMPQYPANGTAVYDDTPGGPRGTGYVFAGGAPLYVQSWSNVGNPSLTPVDGYSLDHYAATGPFSHVRQYPANGTAVIYDNPGPTHGSGREFVGGAPMVVSNWANIGKPKFTGVDSYALNNFADSGALSHARRYPLDGTPVYIDNPGPTHGAGYEYAGGAPLAVSNWANLGKPQIVGVDGTSLTAGSSIGLSRQYPADDTYLRGNQTGEVFRVRHGVARYLSSWALVGGVQPYVGIDQNALDQAGTGGSWNHLISSTPTTRITRPSAKTTSAARITLAWASVPQASKVTGYDVRTISWNTTKPKAWRQPASLHNVTKTSAAHNMTKTHFCLSVRARDLAGKIGAWSKPRCITRT